MQHGKISLWRSHLWFGQRRGRRLQGCHADNAATKRQPDVVDVGTYRRWRSQVNSLRYLLSKNERLSDLLHLSKFCYKLLNLNQVKVSTILFNYFCKRASIVHHRRWNWRTFGLFLYSDGALAWDYSLLIVFFGHCWSSIRRTNIKLSCHRGQSDGLYPLPSHPFLPNSDVSFCCQIRKPHPSIAHQFMQLFRPIHGNSHSLTLDQRSEIENLFVSLFYLAV